MVAYGLHRYIIQVHSCLWTVSLYIQVYSRPWTLRYIMVYKYQIIYLS